MELCLFLPSFMNMQMYFVTSSYWIERAILQVLLEGTAKSMTQIILFAVFSNSNFP